MDYGFDVLATQDEKYNFVIKIARGDYHYSDIVDWINNKIQ